MSTSQSRPEDAGEVPLADALDALFSAEDPAMNFVDLIFPLENEDTFLYIDTPSTGSDLPPEETSGPSQPDVALALMEAWTTPDPPAPSIPEETDKTRSMPWVPGSYGQTADGVGIPRRAGPNANSSGAFDMNSLNDALKGIMTSLQGSFYSSRARHEQFDFITGRRLNNGFRNVIARLEKVDDTILTKMRRQAATMYCAAMASIRTDEALLPILGMQGWPRTHPQSTSGTRRNVLQPAPLQASDNAFVLKNRIFEDQAARNKADRIEEKKRRNRLSAARSNLKRKEVWDAKKRDLSQLKSRVGELKSRKKFLVSENKVLRRVIKSQS